MKGLLFTIVLSYGGALASLFSPFTGLCVYIVFANVRPEFMWFWAIPPGGNYSRVVAAGLLVGWVAQEFLRWRQLEPERGLFTSLVGFAIRPFVAFGSLLAHPFDGPWGRGRVVIACLVACWFWSMLSAALAANQDVAWNFVETFAKILLPILVGMCTVDTLPKLKILAWVIMLSQAYVAYEMNVSYYEGNNRLLIDGFGGMDNNSASIAMVTCTGLAFFLGLNAGHWSLKGLALGSALLMMHSVLFAMSRGGMLALIITGGVTFFLIPKRPIHYLALVLVLLAGYRLAGVEVRDRFYSLFASKEERDFSAQSRLELWKACIDVMKKRPIFGVGPDHWPLIAHTYGFTRGKEAHTLWLAFGAEMGVPGLTLLLGFYGLCMLRLWPLIWERTPVPDPWFRYLAAMVICSLIGFMIAAQFVALKLLEVPYYSGLLGAATLNVYTQMMAARERPPGGPEEVIQPAWAN